MVYLLITSLIWAFSFGLTGKYLAGIDSYFLAWARLTLALPIFLPLLRMGGLDTRRILILTGIGAVQYGLMYSALFLAFQSLKGHEVALLTVFTPFYVAAIDDLFERRFRLRGFLMAAVAVAGAVVIEFERFRSEGVWGGVLYVQAANLCFAFGQVAYRQFRLKHSSLKDSQIFGWLYLGGVAVTAMATTLSGGWDSFGQIEGASIGVLIYLGVIASGFCFFFWNLGAVRVPAAVLAVFNNLKVPLAVAVSLLVFQEPTDLTRLLIGGTLMLIAIWGARR